MTQRLIAIGDVHGCIDELRALLAALNYDPAADALYFLGDLVDKGPDSHGVLKHVMELLAAGTGDCVLGNHEIKWLKRHARADVVLDTGVASWLAARPLFVRVAAPGGRALFLCHGGIAPRLWQEIGSLRASDAVWTLPKLRETSARDRLKAVEQLAYTRRVSSDGDFVDLDARRDGQVHWQETYDGRVGFAVFGHEPRDAVVRTAHAIGLDTGCCFGGDLSAAIFSEPDRVDIVSVRANRAYAKRTVV